ncbi:glycosyltransferase family 4 protein [Bacteroides sp. AN502(2024)]|uniref:glycosyltransferase family 4 protein n=1 Tax=Bacteroides sp. AN502(2024) TaxID=3160599 RepID=UPI003512920F
MRKKIIIISGVFPPEPLTSAYLNYDLACALSNDYDVTVLRPMPSRPIGVRYPEPLLPDDLPFTCITLKSYIYPQSKMLGRLRESISFGKVCASYIKRHRNYIDFIYNASWQLFGCYLVAKSAVKYGIPYIVPIQDIYPESVLGISTKNIFKRALSHILMNMDKFYQKKSYLVRTISEEMANYLSNTRNIPKDHYLIVNNWQNDDVYVNNIAHLNNDKIIFQFVGSVNAHANVELMISAFANADLQNAELRIYGSGTNKKHCQILTKELGLDNVTFSSVPRSQVPNVQAEADVLLVALPKGYAGLCLPSKITSYMLSGKAILASIDSPSASSRYIHEAKCGIVVEPDDVNSLANAFKRIAQMDRNEIYNWGINSKKFANKYLSRKSNLDIVINAINKILQ